MYDIVIIGAGPAGLSAAITAHARNKNVLVLSNEPQESPLAKAKQIDNYLGMPQASGSTLLEKMVKHVQGLDIPIWQGRVVSVIKSGEGFSVTTGSKLIDASCVILATGAQHQQPFKGEAEYLGRGVSYCATCDGMLFRNATVCVVGLSSEAVAEANFLAELGAQVSFLYQETKNVGEAMFSLDDLSPGITLKKGNVVEIKGDAIGVTELHYKEKGVDKLEILACNGIFVLRPSIAPSTLLAGLELRDGYIATDNMMRTNIEGVFAAGDCTGKPLQIAKAVGEGQVACLSACSE